MSLAPAMARLVSAALAMSVAACSPPGDDGRQDSVSGRQDPVSAESGAADETIAHRDPATASHERMVRTLEDVRRQTDRENVFQGEAPAVEARAALAAIPAGETSRRRWQALARVAHEELRLGNEAPALEHWQAAWDVASTLEGRIEPAEALRTAFDLGVAHLRHAETVNCANRHSGESCILPIRGAGVHDDPAPSREAIRWFRYVFDRTDRSDILSAKALWLLNIAYMTVGEYPDEVPSTYRIPPHVFGDSEGFPTFENIAPELGLDTWSLFGGMIVDDFDGDRWLDVMTSTFDTAGQLRFFKNLGDGSFVERTTEAGLVGLYGGLNLVQADYDNDGDVDVLVLRGAWLSKTGRHPNSLLRNEGVADDGRVRFVDVTFASGLAEVSYPTQTAGWADYDGDGDLDLYIGNEHGEQHFDGPCQLFRNDGPGRDGIARFVDVGTEAGVDHRGFVKGVVWGDYDNDGRPDLYVSTLGGPNRLFHNAGPGDDGVVRFVDVARQLGVDGPVDSFPVWFFDYDNDGFLDLYAPAYKGIEDGVGVVAASYFGAEIPWESSRLYHNEGGRGFREVARETGVSRFHQPMGANFGDIDNDGYLDFYLGTGYPNYEAVMPNVLYVNRGGRAFSDVTLDAGLGHLQKGHAISFADYDHDGDLDVFAQMGGAFPGDRFADALFRNPGFGRGSVALRLVGETSNRSAIGARLEAVLGNGRRVFRHVTSGGSFGSNPLRQTIGLGADDRIERLEVWWPTSGHRQTFSDLEAGKLYVIRESAENLVAIDLIPAED